jgi:hypothetical protein
MWSFYLVIAFILQEPSSLAPSVVLNALTKGIVKKLGAEAFTTQDSGDDNVRKVDTHDHVCVVVRRRQKKFVATFA